MKEDEKSLYNTSSGEIFWKNFLVGFSRGLGGMITYLIMLAIAYFAFFNFVMPKISPFLTSFQKAQDNLERIQNPGSMFGGFLQDNSDAPQPTPSRNTR